MIPRMTIGMFAVLAGVGTTIAQHPDPTGGRSAPPGAMRQSQAAPPTQGAPPQHGQPLIRTARLGRPVAAAPANGVRQASDAAPAPATPQPLPGYVPTDGDLGFAPREGCPTCGTTGCNPACGPAGRVWVNFEWLYWATSGQSLPPLATTAPTGGTGALGPGTTVLFGGQRANDDFRNGFRLTGGVWLNAAQTIGVEGDFFFTGRSRQAFAGSSTGSPLLTRPFINALTGLEDSQIVAAPGIASGTLSVDARSSIIGGGVNLLCNLHCSPCGRLDFVVGYRNLVVRDDITIQENPLTQAGANLPNNTLFQITDQFKTGNYFNGGVLGLAGERRFGSFFVGMRASVALGVVRQTTDINGTTVRTLPGQVPTSFVGGLLAQTSNIGHYETTKFAVLPEIGLKFGVQLTEHCRVYAGYNFMYLSSVVRAGDQIDRRVNPNLLPPAIPGGPALPSYTRKTTDFWIQGVSAGLEFRF